MKLKVQEWKGGRFHQDGREAGYKWSLRRNTAWERKADESPVTVTACYGYYEESILQLDGAFQFLQ